MHSGDTEGEGEPGQAEVLADLAGEEVGLESLGRLDVRAWWVAAVACVQCSRRPAWPCKERQPCCEPGSLHGCMHAAVPVPAPDARQ